MSVTQEEALAELEHKVARQARALEVFLEEIAFAAPTNLLDVEIAAGRALNVLKGVDV